MRCCGSRGRGPERRFEGFARPSRRGGLLSGGCRWTAGQLGLPTWVVLAFFMVLFLTIGWPALVIYLACALLLRPQADTGPAADAPLYDLPREASDIRDRTRDLEARIARMESHVTSREFDFDRRLADADRPRR
jgi:phage shock protein C